MFDAAKSRESCTRRVMAYLASVDKATGSSESLWDKLSGIAGAVATGTDFLRVDFFLNAETGQFWLNEMDTTFVVEKTRECLCMCVVFLSKVIWVVSSSMCLRVYCACALLGTPT